MLDETMTKISISKKESKFHISSHVFNKFTLLKLSGFTIIFSCFNVATDQDTYMCTWEK